MFSIKTTLKAKTGLFTALLATLLATTLAAQPRKGDLIVASISSQGGKGGIFSVDWNTGALRTITTAFRVNSVRTMWGNAGMLATDFPTNRVYQVQPNGALRTVYTAANGQAPQNIAIDQQGRYVGASVDGRILKYYLSGGLESTLANAGSNLTGLTRDERTGDYFAARHTDNRILRIARETGRVTTFASLGGTTDIFDIASVPSTGEFVVASFDIPNGIQFIRQNGTVRKKFGIGNRVHSVTVDQVRDRIFVATQTGVIAEFDSNGTFVWSRSYPGFNFAGMDVYGDQNVSMLTSGKQLSLAVMQMEFPESPNRNYCAALSLGNGPAISFGPEQNLNLAIDQMFLMTACGNLPFWTRNFAGTTSSTGRAVATFVVPPMPFGTRIFAGAVAINPARPNGVDVSNTEVVEVLQ